MTRQTGTFHKISIVFCLYVVSGNLIVGRTHVTLSIWILDLTYERPLNLGHYLNISS